MKKFASRIGVSLLLVALLLASVALPARAAATTIMENDVKVPMSFGRLVSCAAGGAGEMVDFTGYYQVMYRLTISSGGPVSYRIQTLAQNVKGIGQVTGETYVFSGGFTETGELPMITFGETYTSFFDSRIIGQGSGNNYIARTVIHYTINANGELVVDIDFSDATCG